jgi:hypothetical protein
MRITQSNVIISTRRKNKMDKQSKEKKYSLAEYIDLFVKEELAKSCKNMKTLYDALRKAGFDMGESMCYISLMQAMDRNKEIENNG